VLFSDAFDRNDSSGLGADWTIASGAFITDSRANADRFALDRAYVANVACADCEIETRLVGFGTELAVTLREASGGDRYDAAITSSGRLRIRRWRGGTATVLGDVASGIPDVTDWATIRFNVTGAAPVVLTAAVNGTTKLTVADASSQALTAQGRAGISATAAGVWFDDFTLRAASP
jgi:hypothetical protein